MTQANMFEQDTDFAGEADYLIISDGGTRPANPGNGYGSFYLQTKSGKSRKQSYIQFGPNITNNQAEYMALLAGLKNLLATIEQARRKPSEFTVHFRSDSQLMIFQLQGRYGCGDDKLIPLYSEAKALIKLFKAARFEWVRRDEIVKILGH